MFRALSTLPATRPANRFPGGVSGDRGWGRVGATFLAASSCSPNSARGSALRASRIYGNSSCLFGDVVTDVLDEHGHLGVESLIRRLHAGQLGEHPLDDVVLLEGLEDHARDSRAR